jgi:hypothetical protein
MSTVRKRINSTGRKRIPRERVNLTLLPVRPDEPLRAVATVRLDGLGFAGDAGVVLEAYQRSSAMRMELGTVEQYAIPEPIVLSELDPGVVPLFRLKIVDNNWQKGKLLGAAERLRPDSDDTPDGRESLFPVRFVELHDEVWKLQMDGAGPCLLLNCRIPTLKSEIQRNPLIAGILLPAALRGVLEDLARDANETEEDDTAWKSKWLRYCREELGIDDDPGPLSEDERKGWVDDGVRAFCKSAKFMAKIRKQWVEGAQ